MGKTNLNLSKKCPKCNQVRFKDIPRNRYFALSTDESVLIANTLLPNLVLELNSLICVNCYNKARRIYDEQFEKNTFSSNDSNFIEPEVHDNHSLVNGPPPSFDLAENSYEPSVTNSIDQTISQDFSDVSTKTKNEKKKAQEVSHIPKHEESIYVDLPKSYSSHKKCIICKGSQYKLRFIQADARTQVLLKKNIFIPNGCRTCQSHLDENGLFKKECFDLIEAEVKKSKINQQSVNDLIKTLLEASRKKNLFEDFSNLKKIDDETCKVTTGFSKEEFIILNGYLDEMRDSDVRTKSQALAIYLFWLKTGMSQEAIRAHFKLNDRVEVSRYCEQVRSSLLANFVPEHLGAQCLERSEFIKQNTDLAKELYSLSENQLVVIVDGKLIHKFYL